MKILILKIFRFNTNLRSAIELENNHNVPIFIF